MIWLEIEMLLLHEGLQDGVEVVQAHDEAVIGPLVAGPALLCHRERDVGEVDDLHSHLGSLLLQFLEYAS